MKNVNSMTEKTVDSATGAMPNAVLNGSRKMPYESGVPNVNTIAIAPTVATSQLYRLSGVASGDTPVFHDRRQKGPWSPSTGCC